jgi:hypothetical protein
VPARLGVRASWTGDAALDELGVVAETYGLDSPVGQRLAKTAAYLERVSLDIMESADRPAHPPDVTAISALFPAP